MNEKDTKYMIDHYEQDEEALRRVRIAKRRAQMRREKERQRQLRRKLRLYGVVATGCICFILLIILIQAILPKAVKKDENTANTSGTPGIVAEVPSGENTSNQSVGNGDITSSEQTDATMGQGEFVGEDSSMPPAQSSNPEKVMVGDKEFWGGYAAEVTTDTAAIYSEEVMSTYAIVVDASTGKVVANREGMTRINPASMTKILTVLVAAEQIQDLEEEVTITFEMTDYAYVNDCSVAGFEVDEKVPVKDLFYGTILPSGGEAAMALAIHTAGSEEAFMELMNKKLEELGLSDTAHFTNCVGLYGDNHYCTVYDMAIILKAALENELCREVITSRTYQTATTEQHPEGLLLSNWFLRRIEDKDCGGQVLGAKTGYVNESGSCAASYGVSASGTPYICVTANAHSSWRCIYDHVEIYKTYAK